MVYNNSGDIMDVCKLKTATGQCKAKEMPCGTIMHFICYNLPKMKPKLKRQRLFNATQKNKNRSLARFFK